MEADISTLRKTGHFYFALTPVNLYGGKRLLRRWFASIRQSLSAGAGG